MSQIPTSGSLQSNATQQYQQAVGGYANAAAQYGATQAQANQAYNQLYAQQAAYGQSQKLALSQQYQQQLAQNQQSMLAAGLGNTSVLQSGARGINYDYANSLLTLNDQLYQRENAIKQAQLGFEQQGAATLAGLQGQGYGLSGQMAQQNQQGATQLAGLGQQLAQQYQLGILGFQNNLQVAAMRGAYGGSNAGYGVPVTENYQGGGSNLANMTQFGSPSNPSGYVDSSVSGDSSPSYYGYSGY